MPQDGEKHAKCNATWDAESEKWKCGICGELFNGQGLVGHFNFSAGHESYGSGSSGSTKSATPGGCQHSWRPLNPRRGKKEAAARTIGWTHVCKNCGELGLVLQGKIVTEDDLHE